MGLWRVENGKEIGPYHNNGWEGNFDLGQAHGHNSPMHPAISGGACAFRTPAELHRWFSGFWSRLMIAGFRIVEVDVEGSSPIMRYPSDVDSRGQVVFTGIHPRRAVEFPEFLEAVFG